MSNVQDDGVRHSGLEDTNSNDSFKNDGSDPQEHMRQHAKFVIQDFDILRLLEQERNYLKVNSMSQNESVKDEHGVTTFDYNASKSELANVPSVTEFTELYPTSFISLALLDCVRIALDLVKQSYLVEAADLLRDAAVEKVSQFSKFDSDCLSKSEKFWNRVSSYLCHSLRAAIFNHMARFQDAYDSATLAIRYLASDDFAFSSRSYSLCCMTKYLEALEDAHMALSLNPLNDAAFGNSSSAHLGLGSIDSAIASAKSSIKLNPDNSASRFNLLSAYLRKAGLAHLTDLEKGALIKKRKIRQYNKVDASTDGNSVNGATGNRNEHKRRLSVITSDGLAAQTLELELLDSAGPAARSELLHMIRREAEANGEDSKELIALILNPDRASKDLLQEGEKAIINQDKASQKYGSRFWTRLKRVHPRLFERIPALKRLAIQGESDQTSGDFSKRSANTIELTDSRRVKMKGKFPGRANNINEHARKSQAQNSRPWSAIGSPNDHLSESDSHKRLDVDAADSFAAIFKDNSESGSKFKANIELQHKDLEEEVEEDRSTAVSHDEFDVNFIENESDSVTRQRLKDLLQVYKDWARVADHPSIIESRNAALKHLKVLENDAQNNAGEGTCIYEAMPRATVLLSGESSAYSQKEGCLTEMNRVFGDGPDMEVVGPSISAQKMLLDSLDDLITVYSLRTSILSETLQMRIFDDDFALHNQSEFSSHEKQSTLRSAVHMTQLIDPGLISPYQLAEILYAVLNVFIAVYEAHLLRLRSSLDASTLSSYNNVSKLSLCSVIKSAIKVMKEASYKIADALAPKVESKEDVMREDIMEYESLLSGLKSCVPKSDSEGELMSTSLKYVHDRFTSHLIQMVKLLSNNDPHVRLAAKNLMIVPEIDVTPSDVEDYEIQLEYASTEPAKKTDPIIQNMFDLFFLDKKRYSPNLRSEEDKPDSINERKLTELKNVEILESSRSLLETVGESGIQLIGDTFKKSVLLLDNDMSNFDSANTPDDRSNNEDIIVNRSQIEDEESNHSIFEKVSQMNSMIARASLKRIHICAKALHLMGISTKGTYLPHVDELSTINSAIKSVFSLLGSLSTTLGCIPFHLQPDIAEILPRALSMQLCPIPFTLNKKQADLPPAARQVLFFVSHAKHQIIAASKTESFMKKGDGAYSDLKCTAANEGHVKLTADDVLYLMSSFELFFKAWSAENNLSSCDSEPQPKLRNSLSTAKPSPLLTAHTKLATERAMSFSTYSNVNDEREPEGMVPEVGNILGCVYAERYRERVFSNPNLLIQSLLRVSLRVFATTYTVSKSNDVLGNDLVKECLSLATVLGLGIGSKDSEESKIMYPLGECESTLFVSEDTNVPQEMSIHFPVPLLTRTLSYFLSSSPLPNFPLRFKDLKGFFEKYGQDYRKDSGTNNSYKSWFDVARDQIALLSKLSSAPSLNCAMKSILLPIDGSYDAEHYRNSVSLDKHTHTNPIVLSNQIRAIISPVKMQSLLSANDASMFSRKARLSENYSQNLAFLPVSVRDVVLPEANERDQISNQYLPTGTWVRIAAVLTSALAQGSIVKKSLSQDDVRPRTNQRKVEEISSLEDDDVLTNIGTGVNELIANANLANGSANGFGRRRQQQSSAHSVLKSLDMCNEVINRNNTHPLSLHKLVSKGYQLFLTESRAGTKAFSSQTGLSECTDIERQRYAASSTWLPPSMIFREPDKGPGFSEQSRELIAAYTLKKNLINSVKTMKEESCLLGFEAILSGHKLSMLRHVADQSLSELILPKQSRECSSDLNHKSHWDAEIPPGITEKYDPNGMPVRSLSVQPVLTQLHHCMVLAKSLDKGRLLHDMGGEHFPDAPINSGPSLKFFVLEGAVGSLIMLEELRNSVSISLRVAERHEKHRRHQALTAQMTSILEESLVLSDICIHYSSTITNNNHMSSMSVTVSEIAERASSFIERGSSEVGDLCEGLVEAARKNEKNLLSQIIDVLEMAVEDDHRETVTSNIVHWAKSNCNTSSKPDLALSASSTQSENITLNDEQLASILSQNQPVRPLLRVLRKLSDKCDHTVETKFMATALLQQSEETIKEFVLLSIELFFPEGISETKFFTPRIIGESNDIGSKLRQNLIFNESTMANSKQVRVFDLISKIMTIECGSTDRPFTWVEMLFDPAELGLLFTKSMFVQNEINPDSYSLIHDLINNFPRVVRSNPILNRLLVFLRSNLRHLAFSRENRSKWQLHDRVLQKSVISTPSIFYVDLLSLSEALEKVQTTQKADRLADKHVIWCRKISTWLKGSFSVSSFHYHCAKSACSVQDLICLFLDHFESIFPGLSYLAKETKLYLSSSACYSNSRGVKLMDDIIWIIKTTNIPTFKQQQKSSVTSAEIVIDTLATSHLPNQKLRKSVSSIDKSSQLSEMDLFLMSLDFIADACGVHCRSSLHANRSRGGSIKVPTECTGTNSSMAYRHIKKTHEDQLSPTVLCPNWLVASRLKAMCLLAASLRTYLGLNQKAKYMVVLPFQLLASPAMSPLAPLLAPSILTKYILPELSETTANFMKKKFPQQFESHAKGTSNLTAKFVLTSLSETLLRENRADNEHLAYNTLMTDALRSSAGLCESLSPLIMSEENQNEEIRETDCIDYSIGKYVFSIRALIDNDSLLLSSGYIHDVNVLRDSHTKQTSDLSKYLPIRDNLQSCLESLKRSVDNVVRNIARAEKLKALMELCDRIDEAGSSQRLSQSGSPQSVGSWISLVFDSVSDMLQKCDMSYIIARTTNANAIMTSNADTSSNLTCRRHVMNDAVKERRDYEGGFTQKSPALDSSSALEQVAISTVTSIRSALAACASRDASRLYESLSIGQANLQLLILLLKTTPAAGLTAPSRLAPGVNPANVLKALASRQMIVTAVGGLCRAVMSGAYVSSVTKSYSKLVNFEESGKYLGNEFRASADLEYSQTGFPAGLVFAASLRGSQRGNFSTIGVQGAGIERVKEIIAVAITQSKYYKIISASMQLGMLDRNECNFSVDKLKEISSSFGDSFENLLKSRIRNIVDNMRLSTIPSISYNLSQINTVDRWSDTTLELQSKDEGQGNDAEILISRMSNAMTSSWNPAGLLLSDYSDTINGIVEAFAAYLRSLPESEADSFIDSSVWRNFADPSNLVAKSWQNAFLGALASQSLDKSYGDNYGETTLYDKSFASRSRATTRMQVESSAQTTPSNDPHRHVLSVLRRARTAVEWQIQHLRHALPSDSLRSQDPISLYSLYSLTSAAVLFANSRISNNEKQESRSILHRRVTSIGKTVCSMFGLALGNADNNDSQEFKNNYGSSKRMLQKNRNRLTMANELSLRMEGLMMRMNSENKKSLNAFTSALVKLLSNAEISNQGQGVLVTPKHDSYTPNVSISEGYATSVDTTEDSLGETFNLVKGNSTSDHLDYILYDSKLLSPSLLRKKIIEKSKGSDIMLNEKQELAKGLEILTMPLTVNATDDAFIPRTNISQVKAHLIRKQSTRSLEKALNERQSPKRTLRFLSNPIDNEALESASSRIQNISYGAMQAQIGICTKLKKEPTQSLETKWEQVKDDEIPFSPRWKDLSAHAVIDQQTGDEIEFAIFGHILKTDTHLKKRNENTKSKNPKRYDAKTIASNFRLVYPDKM